MDIAASAIGSLTNPLKLSNAFKSMSQKHLSDKTIKQYLDYLIDAFMLEKAVRYDVKREKCKKTVGDRLYCSRGIRSIIFNPHSRYLRRKKSSRRKIHLIN